MFLKIAKSRACISSMLFTTSVKVLPRRIVACVRGKLFSHITTEIVKICTFNQTLFFVYVAGVGSYQADEWPVLCFDI